MIIGNLIAFFNLIEKEANEKEKILIEYSLEKMKTKIFSILKKSYMNIRIEYISKIMNFKSSNEFITWLKREYPNTDIDGKFVHFRRPKKNK